MIEEEEKGMERKTKTVSFFIFNKGKSAPHRSIKIIKKKNPKECDTLY